MVLEPELSIAGLQARDEKEDKDGNHVVLQVGICILAKLGVQPQSHFFLENKIYEIFIERKRTDCYELNIKTGQYF